MWGIAAYKAAELVRLLQDAGFDPHVVMTRAAELEPTEDILSEVVRRRKAKTLVIGFAAETEDVLANGREKLERKGVDAVVVNDVPSHETALIQTGMRGVF